MRSLKSPVTKARVPLWKRLLLKSAPAWLALLIGGVYPANAAIQIERKIGQFGSPIELRLECAKWAIYHVPEIHRWHVRMVERRDCIGHSYKALQHEFFLTANGPDVDEAAKKVLEEALVVSVSAAVGTGLLMPTPEPASRIGTAIVAGKEAFIGYLNARGLERLVSQYDLRIDHRTHW